MEHIKTPADLVRCGCVSKTWQPPALKALWRGSINDMRFRTPEIPLLHDHSLASRKRFDAYLQHADHLTISYIPNNSGDDTRLSAGESVSCPIVIEPGKGSLTSLAIPCDLIDPGRCIGKIIRGSRIKVLRVDHRTMVSIMRKQPTSLPMVSRRLDSKLDCTGDTDFKQSGSQASRHSPSTLVGI